jgi:hypothetical protein
MSNINVEPAQKTDEVLYLVQSAIEGEITRLKLTLKLAGERLALFEAKYGVTSEYFMSDMAAEDLEGGDDEYVRWAGEYELVQQLQTKLRQLEDISRGAVHTAKVEREGGWPSIAKLIEFIIAPATILTALAYLMGWIYKQNYFASFGIKLESLGFPPQYYLTASWTSFFLGVTLLLAGAAGVGLASLRCDAEGTESAPAKGLQRLLWILSPRRRLRYLPMPGRIILALVPFGIVWLCILSEHMWFPQGEDTWARLLGSQDLVLGFVLLVFVCVAIALLWGQPLEWLKVPPFALWLMGTTLVVFYSATLLCMAGWLGLYHARGAIGCSKLPSSEITFYSLPNRPLNLPEPTLARIPDVALGSTQVISVSRYANLRLIVFTGSQYYVFRPGQQSAAEAWQPQVYIVPADQIIFVEFKPPKIFYPVY